MNENRLLVTILVMHKLRMSAARMLAIDECEEWIWHILDCTKDCGFEYISDTDKEFLIFNTNDFFADMKALQKIKKITGMILVQMSTSQLSYATLVCEKQKSSLI